MAQSYYELRAKLQDAVANRKRLLVKGLLATFALLVIPIIAFNLVDFDGFGPGVTLANFRRLHVGMDRQSVEAVLGSKGNDVLHMSDWAEVRDLEIDEAFWKGKKLIIFVSFTNDDRVKKTSMTWHDSKPPPDSFSDMVNRLFGSRKK
jgi:hypothetical protein